MQRRTVIYSGLLVFSILGLLNAAYLSLMSLTGSVPTCNFIQGCDVVAQSEYSIVFGIPLALFGVFFYVLVGGFALWGLFDRTVQIKKIIIVLTSLGFLLSLYFLYLQVFVINAFCEYCLFSLFDASVLFVLSFFIPSTNDGILHEHTERL